MAKITFSSEVNWTGKGVSCDAITGKHTVRIDEPPSLGGKNTGPNPVELILSGLGGCLIILVNAFASSHNVEITDVKVDVYGDLDPDGFLGLSDVRPGFSEIRYKLNIESPSPAENIAALKEHATRACPVKDTLKGVTVKSV